MPKLTDINNVWLYKISVIELLTHFVLTVLRFWDLCVSYIWNSTIEFLSWAERSIFWCNRRFILWLENSTAQFDLNKMVHVPTCEQFFFEKSIICTSFRWYICQMIMNNYANGHLFPSVQQFFNCFRLGTKKYDKVVNKLNWSSCLRIVVWISRIKIFQFS